MQWGSDAMAEALRRLGLKYVALNPGASFRGLPNSIVNYLGNQNPEIILCLHEEHASMAVHCAWCDRAPVVIIGATGPIDAAMRRPY